MDIIKEKWEEILYTVKLEHEITDVSFTTWLKPLKVKSLEVTIILLQIIVVILLVIG